VLAGLGKLAGNILEFLVRAVEAGLEGEEHGGGDQEQGADD